MRACVRGFFGSGSSSTPVSFFLLSTIDAVQIYGGYGFVNDFPVEKLMRDARAFEALHGDERLGRVLAAREKMSKGVE